MEGVKRRRLDFWCDGSLMHFHVHKFLEVSLASFVYEQHFTDAVQYQKLNNRFDQYCIILSHWY